MTMSEDTIRVVEIIETKFGEQAVLESEMHSRHFIKAMPWKTVEEEIEEHGSRRAKMDERSIPESAQDAAEDFDWSDEFAGHATYEKNVRGPGENAWTIDAEHLDEALEFFEHCGYDTLVSTEVAL